MNNALLNYLQQSQGQNQGPQQQAQAPYNPFDAGIRKAIEGARQSLNMNREQEDRALRNSMLAFANNISQQPRERGFANNLASAGRAMIPAMSAYDQSEQAAFQENNELANQILQHQAAEQARQAQEEERQFWRQNAQEQLAEKKRSTNLLDNFKRNKEAREMAALENKLGIASNNKKGKSKGHPQSATDDNNLAKLLNDAEDLISETGDRGRRGRLALFANKVLPGGYARNEQQASIDALGDVLKGKLFNTWGYRNQAEFEHVPTISSENPPEVNLAIIKQLKDSLLNREPQINEEALLLDQLAVPETESLPAVGDSILMQDPTGAQYRIPANEMEEALRDGLTLVE